MDDILKFILKYWLEIVFSGVIGLLVKGYNHFQRYYKSENQLQNEKLDVLESNLAKMKTDSENNFLKIKDENKRSNKELQNKQNDFCNGIQALIRDRMIQSTDHFRDLGYCPTHSLETLEKLYKEYKNLGGNGAVKALIAEMRELPRSKKKKGSS